MMFLKNPPTFLIPSDNCILLYMFLNPIYNSPSPENILIINLLSLNIFELLFVGIIKFIIWIIFLVVFTFIIVKQYWLDTLRLFLVSFAYTFQQTMLLAFAVRFFEVLSLYSVNPLNSIGVSLTQDPEKLLLNQVKFKSQYCDFIVMFAVTFSNRLKLGEALIGLSK